MGPCLLSAPRHYILCVSQESEGGVGEGGLAVFARLTNKENKVCAGPMGGLVGFHWFSRRFVGNLFGI